MNQTLKRLLIQNTETAQSRVPVRTDQESPVGEVGGPLAEYSSLGIEGSQAMRSRLELTGSSRGLEKNHPCRAWRMRSSCALSFWGRSFLAKWSDVLCCCHGWTARIVYRISVSVAFLGHKPTSTRSPLFTYPSVEIDLHWWFAARFVGDCRLFCVCPILFLFSFDDISSRWGRIEIRPTCHGILSAVQYVTRS